MATGSGFPHGNAEGAGPSPWERGRGLKSVPMGAGLKGRSIAVNGGFPLTPVSVSPPRFEQEVLGAPTPAPPPNSGDPTAAMAVPPVTPVTPVLRPIIATNTYQQVNDEILARAFGRFPSFLKAKVIRDKRTGKTKGYGFVSFKDPADYVRAMREMNGKYVGSRPIKLRKSMWKDRNLEVVRRKQREKKKLGLR
uniref:RNA-binding protein 42 n=1 Tax=Melopsittacus undulatus TaxID=13146 RepID=A0A8V5G9Q0_MELUD